MSYILQLLGEVLASIIIVIPALLPQVCVAFSCIRCRAAGALGFLVWPVCRSFRESQSRVPNGKRGDEVRRLNDAPSTGKSSNSSSSSSGTGAFGCCGLTPAGAPDVLAEVSWSLAVGGLGCSLAMAEIKRNEGARRGSVRLGSKSQSCRQESNRLSLSLSQAVHAQTRCQIQDGKALNASERLNAWPAVGNRLRARDRGATEGKCGWDDDSRLSLALV